MAAAGGAGSGGSSGSLGTRTVIGSDGEPLELEIVPQVDPTDDFSPMWTDLPEIPTKEESEAVFNDFNSVAPGDEIEENIGRSESAQEALVSIDDAHPKGKEATARELIALGTAYCEEAADKYMASIPDDEPATWEAKGLSSFFVEDYRKSVIEAVGGLSIGGHTLEEAVKRFWDNEYEPAKYMDPNSAQIFMDPRKGYPKLQASVDRAAGQYQKAQTAVEAAMNKVEEAKKELGLAEDDLVLSEEEAARTKAAQQQAEAHKAELAEARKACTAKQSEANKAVSAARQTDSKAKQAARKATQAAAAAARKADPGLEGLQAAQTEAEAEAEAAAQGLQEAQAALEAVKEEMKAITAQTGEATKAASAAKKEATAAEKAANALRLAIKSLPRKVATFEKSVEDKERGLGVSREGLERALERMREGKETGEATIKQREEKLQEAMSRFTAGQAAMGAFSCEKYRPDVRRGFLHMQLRKRREEIDSRAAPYEFEVMWKTEDNEGQAKHGARRWEIIKRNDRKRRAADNRRRQKIREEREAFEKALRGF